MVRAPSMNPRDITAYNLKAAAIEASLMSQILQKAASLDSSSSAMEILRNMKAIDHVESFLSDGRAGKWTIRDLSEIVAALGLKINLEFHTDSE